MGHPLLSQKPQMCLLTLVQSSKMMMSFLSIEKPQGQLLMALELLGTLTSKVIMAAGATASKSSFLNKTFMT